MQNHAFHPALVLNKETIIRFKKPRQQPDRAFGKNGVAILACCGRLSFGSSTLFTVGLQ